MAEMLENRSRVVGLNSNDNVIFFLSANDRWGTTYQLFVRKQRTEDGDYSGFDKRGESNDRQIATSSASRAIVDQILTNVMTRRSKPTPKIFNVQTRTLTRNRDGQENGVGCVFFFVRSVGLGKFQFSRFRRIVNILRHTNNNVDDALRSHQISFFFVY